MKRIRFSQRGSIAVNTALLLVVLCGMAALTIDIGQLYIARQRAQNAADSAALAGASAYPDRLTMDSRAKEYSAKNGVNGGRITITIDPANASLDPEKINAECTVHVDFSLAKVLGFTDKDVIAHAAAAFDGVSTIGKGLVPFGVIDTEVMTVSTVGGKTTYTPIYSVGSTYNLKTTNWRDYADYPGNFGAVSLTEPEDEDDDSNGNGGGSGKGASAYRNNIINGSPYEFEIGDTIYTKPGNMVGPTAQGVGVPDVSGRLETTAFSNNLTAYTSWMNAGMPKDSRVITVPIIHFPNGKSKEEISDTSSKGKKSGRVEVTIVGFAAYFLEGFQETTVEVPDKKNKTKKIQVTRLNGRFIGLVTNEQGGGINTGLRTIKLVE